MSVKTGIIILYVCECGHVQPGRPNQLHTTCYTCNKEVLTVDVHEWEWHMKCVTCNAGKWTGLSQILASQHANAHSLKKPTHEVKVLYQQNPASRVTLDKMMKNGAWGK